MTAESSAPAFAASRQVPQWCWAALGVLQALKLVLVSHDEVITWGKDAGEYVGAAAAWYWGQAYQECSYARQPVYPLFLSLTSAMGIPARLAAELVWGASCAVLMVTLRRFGVSAVGALLAAALTMFHPWTIAVFFRLFQDELYAPLFLTFTCACAAGAIAWSRRDLVVWGSVATVTGALAANTRPEGIVLVPVLGMTAVAIVAARWVERAGAARTRLMLARLMAVVVLPLAGWQGLTNVVCAVNQRMIGVYATCDMAAPGFTALYDTLLAIPPPPEHADPRVPIRKDVREKAYAASPTFALLRPWLEDPSVNRIARAEATPPGPEKKWGADSYWAVRSAAWKYRSDWSSAGEIDAFYMKAAGELRAAMGRGELGRRAVPLAFVPPEWEALVRREVPRSVWLCLSHLRRPWTGPGPMDQVTARKAQFDAVAVRRVVQGAIRSGERVEGSAWYGARGERTVEKWKKRLERGYAVVGWIAAAVLPLGLVAAVIGYRRRRIGGRWFVLAGIFWAAIVSRLALVVLLDATGVEGQARYMLSAVGMLAGMVVVSGGAVLSVGGKRKAKSEERK